MSESSQCPTSCNLSDPYPCSYSALPLLQPQPLLFPQLPRMLLSSPLHVLFPLPITHFPTGSWLTPRAPSDSTQFPATLWASSYCTGTPYPTIWLYFSPNNLPLYICHLWALCPFSLPSWNMSVPGNQVFLFTLLNTVFPVPRTMAGIYRD